VSYRGHFNASRIRPDGREFALNSYRGRLSISFLDLNGLPVAPKPTLTEPHWSFHSIRPHAEMDRDWRKVKPFALRLNETLFKFSVAVPYWLPVWLSGVTILLTFKRPWRFTTRDLLVFTTAMAFLLAAIGETVRDWPK
jgi:hypothetical protein